MSWFLDLELCLAWFYATPWDFKLLLVTSEFRNAVICKADSEKGFYSKLSKQFFGKTILENFLGHLNLVIDFFKLSYRLIL